MGKNSGRKAKQIQLDVSWGHKPPAAAVAPEAHLRLRHPAVSPAHPIVDTHTHLALTFEAYCRKYPAGEFKTAFEFVRGLYVPAGVEAMVDVWCEAPVRRLWREFADAALTEAGRRDVWGGVEYWFVMGVHPHNASQYTDKIEADIIEAMAHPRCVGWGECGLDYHYDTSPRPVQREVFVRQLRCAVRLGKPLTIHSREADADTERILKEEVPKDHRIHIHCFTNAPAFAQRLLDWFPNLYIGVTGAAHRDAPYMVPSTIYSSASANSVRGTTSAANSGTATAKLPLSHCGMLPWTAAFIAGLLPRGAGIEPWDAARVLKVGRENARGMYGV
ncbi:Metallo-dependent hydrolase [Mycena rosella]|uniref:Metallo-dependent hydrolase n=1 Tax=Mycena rosella TaxID=1033263 RepID=A0AAD7CXP8_MYCRO|nr:Metallo-dependent hydrolase [Mycena rosella]